jgi:hypothetical protein
MSDFNDAAYWLERADQARQIAESFAYERARWQMIGLAEGYEQMAKMAEEMKLATRSNTSPFLSRPCVDQIYERPSRRNDMACMSVGKARAS